MLLNFTWKLMGSWIRSPSCTTPSSDGRRRTSPNSRGRPGCRRQWHCSRTDDAAHPLQPGGRAGAVLFGQGCPRWQRRGLMPPVASAVCTWKRWMRQVPFASWSTWRLRAPWGSLCTPWTSGSCQECKVQCCPLAAPTPSKPQPGPKHPQQGGYSRGHSKWTHLGANRPPPLLGHWSRAVEPSPLAAASLRPLVPQTMNVPPINQPARWEPPVRLRVVLLVV
mmetsp:Transcript_32058/g.57485  ORF Transcript_32058/g.57485 Transcript_32058/m.57485 type:complete len:222 (+) Transcript_32058:1558-2223(+)